MDRAFILPNCVDLDRFRPQHRDARLVERYGLQSSKVILTVGRLASTERYKGFDQVIELMPQLIKRFPNLKYLIVGDGDDRSRLEEKVEALGLSNCVIFAGYIPEVGKGRALQSGRCLRHAEYGGGVRDRAPGGCGLRRPGRWQSS